MLNLIQTLFAFVFLFSTSTQASQIWLQPTEYLGPRNNNPFLQSYFGTSYETSSPNTYVSLHYESELIGTRHDFSLDLDRAYVKVDEFYFGRVHLWDLVDFKDRRDLWGMLAQFQPINMGIQLNPILIAPLGVHYLHLFNRDLKLGFSASPFAVPNLGSEVSLNENSVSTNRFGRLPPGSVTVNNTDLPLRYQIDAGSIFTDVLLKPNIAGIFADKVYDDYSWVVGASFAPDPNPVAEVASSFVRVDQDQLTAVAVIHPKFLYRTTAYTSHTVRLPATAIYLEGKVLLRDDPIQSVEILARYENFVYVAYAQSFPNTLYLDHLFRVGVQVPLPEGFSIQSDLRTQLTQNQSVWINGTLHFKPARTKMDWFLACDAFSGEDYTYFGEWRTNDRVYGGLNIRI